MSAIGRTFRAAAASRGQAMAELTICAAYVLVPLFLLIPLLGKYIDLRHTAIQAARYETWEYTVWYSRSSDRPRGYTHGLPVKTAAEVADETRRRFFSDTSIPIRDSDKLGWNAGEANMLWRDHAGLEIYSPGGDIFSSSGSQPTPDPTHIFTNLLGIVDMVFEALADVMSFFSIDAGFTAINADGYYQSDVSVPVATSTFLLPATTMDAQGGVLSDGWNAGGVAHTAFQAAGIVPTKILDNPLMNGFQSIVGALAPELRPCDPLIPFPPWESDDAGSLWFGYVDIDAVHPDRLEPGGSHSCNDAGMCDFDPMPAREARIVASGLCQFVPL